MRSIFLTTPNSTLKRSPNPHEQLSSSTFILVLCCITLNLKQSHDQKDKFLRESICSNLEKKHTSGIDEYLFNPHNHAAKEDSPCLAVLFKLVLER